MKISACKATDSLAPCNPERSGVTMRAEAIALDDLLLDPNNYRLQEQDDFVLCAEDRFHLERVQSGTLRRLQKESLRPLRDSIVSNGFLEIERIVVTPYEHEQNKFVVIEGNRRVAALRQIRDEYNGGVDIPAGVVAVFDAVPCLVADDPGQEAYFREALMGIRHVGGIREWGGYQRAKLIAELKDNHELEPQLIAQKLGLSVQEVNRRYRAYKALEQMKNDEIYSEFATASLYPIFHEAVSLPSVREWLEWNAETNSFFDNENREIFYQLITPRNIGQDDEKEPKIRTYSEVRQLREILANDDAKAELLQLDRELVEAVSVANQDRMARRWRNEISEARAALSKIPGLEIRNFSQADIDAINQLIETANNVLDMNRATQLQT